MTLKKKILDRTASVGILGMGYVGLPLAMEFAARGFSVIGFDTDKIKVRGLRRGRSHISDVSLASLRKELKAKRFRATDNFDSIKDCDAIIICVPTPLRKTKEPDVSYIRSACRAVGARMRRGQLIVLESTTYPGTTREFVLPMLERGGEPRSSKRVRWKAGKDFHLAFSPERVDPANQHYRIPNTPKVVGGITPACTELASLLYEQVIEQVVAVSSASTAEMVKLLENSFRAVNIGLVNEMAQMCHHLGVDIWEIISAAATKPFGFTPFYPGPGVGGHCIPVDPSYLVWKMKELNFEPRLIELASTINAQMPEHVARRLASLLNEQKRPVRGSRILVLGVAYKPGVNDTRESPALDVIKLLLDQGAQVRYHDPYVPRVRLGRRRLSSTALTKAVVRKFDLVVILTAHQTVDYPLVVKSAKLVFDARNATAGMEQENLKRL